MPPPHSCAHARHRINRNVGLDVVTSFSERLVYSNKGLPCLYLLCYISDETRSGWQNGNNQDRPQGVAEDGRSGSFPVIP